MTDIHTTEETDTEQTVHEPEIVSNPNHQTTDLPPLVAKYWRPVAAGVIIMIAAFLGFIAYSNRNDSTETTAAKLFYGATTIQHLEEVRVRYPETVSAPLAILHLAKINYMNGNIEQATKFYNEFETKYPTHELIPVAALGKIFCMEAKGSINESAMAYAEFIKSNSDHFLIPQAVLGNARCLELMNRLEEARIVYDDFLARNSDNPMADTIEQRLAMLEDKMENIAPMTPVQPATAEEITPVLID